MRKSLLLFDTSGIYCPQADVYIDPWRSVKRALITHAHSDHARRGMKHYLAHKYTVPVLRQRLGNNIRTQSVDYGESLHINGVRISFHPAGHIRGSSQIRLEFQGEVWVVSGDYKLDPDPACTPFEVIPCQHFITESTFGLPIYNWRAGDEVMADINRWCQYNRDHGLVSVMYGYSLGKSQRILMGLDPSIGPIFTHPSVEKMNEVLRATGMPLPKTNMITPGMGPPDFKGGILITPQTGEASAMMQQLGPYQTAMASGWMALRNFRKRRNVDKGFVLSDHADFKGLNQAIRATGAERVYVTHGYTQLYTQYLREKGVDAHIVSTEYKGDSPDVTPRGQVDNSEVTPRGQVDNSEATPTGQVDNSEATPGKQGDNSQTSREGED